MAKIRTKQVGGKDAAGPARRSGASRRVHLGSVLVRAKQALREVMLSAGTDVLMALLEEDREALCGPRHEQSEGRENHRYGYDTGPLVLGGRKVAVRKPRVRSIGGDEEIELPTWRQFSDEDPLTERAIEQMLVGVATRQYARSLEPITADIESRGTSKSAVSRRFVAKTQAQLETWQAAPLEDLDLVGLLLDGVHVGEHCLMVALGVAGDGTKHALGLWEGSTENATVCQSLLSNLQSRGLRTDRSLLVLLDGSKALRKAVRETFGDVALGLSEALRRSFSTTNAVESLISRTRHVKRNVKRWRGGQMVVRWVAAGVLEAVKGFRRLKGHKEMPKLIAALRARDQQLGLVVQQSENVA